MLYVYKRPMQQKAFLEADKENRQLILPLICNFLLNLAGFGLFLPIIGLSNSSNAFPVPLAFGGAWEIFLLAELIALFGLGQLFGFVLLKKIAENWGVRTLLLATTLVSFIGYVMLFGAFYSLQSGTLFLGRFLTGLGACNTELCLKLAWNQHHEKNRPHLLPYLMGIAAFGFLIGPWFGVKLLNSDWLGWCTPSGLFSVFYAVNLFFIAMYTPKFQGSKGRISPLKEVLQDLLTLLVLFRCHKLCWSFFLFLGGWVALLVSFPCWIFKNWQVDWYALSDLYAYFTVSWLLGSLFIFPELQGKISPLRLVQVALWILFLSVMGFYFVAHLYWYWLLIPIASFSGSFIWSYVAEIPEFGFSNAFKGRILRVFLLIFSLGITLIPILTACLIEVMGSYPFIFANLQFLLLALIARGVLREIKSPL